MQKIAILGCGWLGLPLAAKLVANKYDVCGSTTSVLKIEKLRSSAINPFLIRLTEHEILGDIKNFLNNNSILIIDIPPKFRSGEHENFVQKIQNLIPYIVESHIMKVIFVTSTSVFCDDNSVVDANTVPNSNSVWARQLYQVEKLLKVNINFKTTIIRFGGLVGAGRHPAKALSGKINLHNRYAPINLIHLKDCIQIIFDIIKNEIWNETFNAVAPYHPNREEYYIQKAKMLGMPIPQFTDNEISVGKTVLSDHLKTVLNYEFQVTEMI